MPEIYRFSARDPERVFLSPDAVAPFVLEDVHYATPRQYLVYQKALFFSDKTAAAKALKGSSPDRLTALEAQLTAAAVKGNGDWLNLARYVCETGLSDRFFQHPEDMRRLLDTGDAVLIFEDPDPFWGSGAAGEGLAFTGENMYGRALMEVRAELSVSMGAFLEKEAPSPIPAAHRMLLQGLLSEWCAPPNAHGTVVSMGSTVLFEAARHLPDGSLAGEDARPFTVSIPLCRYFGSFAEYRALVDELADKQKILKSVTNSMHWILTLYPEEES